MPNKPQITDQDTLESKNIRGQFIPRFDLMVSDRIEVYRKDIVSETPYFHPATILEVNENHTSLYIHCDNGKFVWVNLVPSLRLNVVGTAPPKEDQVFNDTKHNVTYTIKAGTKAVEKINNRVVPSTNSVVAKLESSLQAEFAGKTLDLPKANQLIFSQLAPNSVHATPPANNYVESNRVKIFSSVDNKRMWREATILKISEDKARIYVHFDDRKFRWVELTSTLRIKIIDDEPPIMDQVFNDTNNGVTYTLKAGIQAVSITNNAIGSAGASPDTIASSGPTIAKNQMFKPKSKSKATAKAVKVEPVDRVKILWEGDEAWYVATVLEVDLKKQEMLVCYEDDNLWSTENLRDIKFEVISTTPPSEFKDFFNPATNIRYTIYPDSKDIIKTLPSAQKNRTESMTMAMALKPIVPKKNKRLFKSGEFKHIVELINQRDNNAFQHYMTNGEGANLDVNLLYEEDASGKITPIATVETLLTYAIKAQKFVCGVVLIVKCNAKPLDRNAAGETALLALIKTDTISSALVSTLLGYLENNIIHVSEEELTAARTKMANDVNVNHKNAVANKLLCERILSHNAQIVCLDVAPEVKPTVVVKPTTAAAFDVLAFAVTNAEPAAKRQNVVIDLTSEDLAVEEAELEKELLRIKELRAMKSQQQQQKQQITVAAAALNESFRAGIPINLNFAELREKVVHTKKRISREIQELLTAANETDLSKVYAKHKDLFAPQFADYATQYRESYAVVIKIKLDLAGEVSSMQLEQPAPSTPTAGASLSRGINL